MAGSTFSDSWHRLAEARVGLLPTVKVHKQLFRGRTWYVLREAYSQRFYRVSPAAYAFLARLTPERTVDETWHALLDEAPEQAPGQEEVGQLLSQLHVANLLYFRSQPDSDAIFERYRGQRRRELLAKLMAFLYVRAPLWNPDPWLEHMQPLGRVLLSRWAALLWLLTVTLGASAALQNGRALLDQSQGLFALSNLAWLYLCLAGLKTLHELGHAFVCKRYGGAVHTMGVMFLIFTPLPYMDASQAWSFRSRWERALVGAAGMIVELYLAAIGAVIWVNTGAGLINSLAFNVMIIGSVSSLLFNGNPLLRFDAYYILVDLIDIPNLHRKAQRQWLYFADRYLLGTPNARSPAEDRREWSWLTAYGALSFFYRLLISAAIVLFVLDRWFEIGIILVITYVFAFVILPIKQLIGYLAGPQLHRNRARAVLSVGLIAALLVVGLGWLPAPRSIKAHGVLEAVQSTSVNAPSGGILVDLKVRSGEVLEPGQVIAVLRNPELVHDIEITRQQLREAKLLRRRALQRSVADLAPLRRRMEVLDKRLAELKKRRQQLTVRAPHAGHWVAPKLHERLGSWIARGAPLGELIDLGRFRFTAVVSQEQADEIFRREISTGKLRLHGQSDVTLPVGHLELIPYQRRRLASPALGWMGGGEIAVSPKSESGTLAAESFYELHAMLPPQASERAVLLPGLSGRLRIALPDEPVYQQLYTALMQLLQKRYQL